MPSGCSRTIRIVKLPAHRAGLPGKEVSFILCPLTPPTRRGLRGTFRSKGLNKGYGYEARIVQGLTAT